MHNCSKQLQFVLSHVKVFQWYNLTDISAVYMEPSAVVARAFLMIRQVWKAKGGPAHWFLLTNV